MLNHLAGSVHPALVGGGEQDCIEVAGEAHEDQRGADGPDTKQNTTSRSCSTDHPIKCREKK
jgi:hypothetical protein